MVIRKYIDSDRDGLIRLWSESFPDDPPHNDPAKMIDAKLLVDDQIFVAEYEGELLGLVWLAMMVIVVGCMPWLWQRGSVAAESEGV